MRGEESGMKITVKVEVPEGNCRGKTICKYLRLKRRGWYWCDLFDVHLDLNRELTKCPACLKACEKGKK